MKCGAVSHRKRSFPSVIHVIQIVQYRSISGNDNTILTYSYSSTYLFILVAAVDTDEMWGNDGGRF